MKRFLSMLLVLAIMVGTVPTALAATPEAQKGYYGNRLTDQEGKVDRAAAIAFYEALGTMNFASGENVPVTDPTVVKLAESYAGGSDTFMITRSISMWIGICSALLWADRTAIMS